MIIKFIKCIFLAELRFESPLTTQNMKCVSLDINKRMTRLTFIDLNANELGRYEFIVSLDKFNGIAMLLMIHQVECMFQIKQTM